MATIKLGLGDVLSHLLRNHFQQTEMDDETAMRMRISKRMQQLADHVQELVKQPCINLKNHGITDLELIRVVLPVMESKIAESKYFAIDLSFNGLTPLCAKELARVLNVVSAKVGIKALHLDGNNWGDSGLSDLCAGFNLKLLSSLEVLTLGFCKITEYGAASLATKVLPHTNLKFLLLDCNPLGPQGVAEVAKGLTDAPKLECLSIGSTNAGNIGTHSIVRALPSMKNIKQLSLAFNQMENESLSSLAKVIAQHSPKLQKLDLSGNLLTDDGLKSLILAIKYSDLDNIDVTGNTFSFELAEEMRTLVTLKKSKWSRGIQALLSAREVPRLGKTAPVSTMPKELIRKLAEFIPQSDYLAQPKPHVFVLNWLLTFANPDDQPQGAHIQQQQSQDRYGAGVAA